MQTMPTPTGAPYAPADEPSWDRPGGLGIRERRSWATWQVAGACLMFLIIGMMVGYSGTRPPKTTTASGTAGGVSLYGPGGTTRSTPTTRPGTAGSPATTVASTNGSVTQPTTPAPAATAADCNVPKRTLLPNTPGTGPNELPTFSTAGPWCIGWVFDCAAAPGGAATFSLLVGDSDIPAVRQASRQGDGVTPQAGVGSQRIRVAADPGCRWAVKVTSA